MNKLKVSIIIPTYNRGHIISMTLDSIINQTYSNWECIIVDDGSTDNTEQIVNNLIKRNSEISYFKRPNYLKKGPSSCRNYGFGLSKGDYINWFDDDDIMLPTAIEERLQKFKDNTDVVICKLMYYDFFKNLILDETNILSEKIIEDYLVGDVTFFVSGPIWRRTFLMNQKELFNEKISNLDDWDFNLRMLYSEPNIEIVNKGLIKYRIHDNSLTKEIIKENFDEIFSESKARLMHLKKLMFNKNINLNKFKEFVVYRTKNYLRLAIIQKSNKKYYLYKVLILFQISSLDILGVIKSSLGFVSYLLVKKGYRFFK